MKKYLISDVCRKYNCSKVTVLNWIKAGHFPGAVLNKGGLTDYWEIPAREVDNFKKPDKGRPKQQQTQNMEVKP